MDVEALEYTDVLVGQMGQSVSRELRELLEELSTRQITAVSETIPDVPYNYEDWLVYLERPDQFLTNMAETEEEVRELKRVKRKMLEVNDDLDRALIRLRLPFLDGEAEENLLQSSEWPEIRELLLLFESRFIPRIPGIVCLLERANNHLYKGKPFVGVEERYGFVDVVDAMGFTEDTILRGASASSRSLSEGLFQPTFDALERADGERLIQIAGDALVPVRQVESLEDERKNHLGFMANVACGLKVPCHITIGEGRFMEIVTPSGKLLILGEAFDRAEAVQGLSKDGINVGDNSIIIFFDEKGDIHYLEVDDYLDERSLPDDSQIQFFMGADTDEIKNDPAVILDGVRRQMALTASPMSFEALQSKETVERSAISLYAQAPIESDNPDEYPQEIFKWEKQLMQLAQKYNAKVKFFTLNGGKKSGILIFGAQGSSQINKEERSARCANELLGFYPTSQIGLKQGAIHVSNMGEKDVSGVQELVSDAVNGSHRLATCLGVPGIRMDQTTYELFKQRGILIVEEKSEEIELKTYGLQTVLVGLGFEIEEIDSYVREDKVEELVGLVSGADVNSVRQWNLTGEFGAGQVSVLQAAAQQLQSEHGMQIVVLSEHHDHSYYSGLRQVFSSIFADIEEFSDWLEKTGAPAGQVEIWKMLFGELVGGEEIFLLNHFDYAKPELANLLSFFGENFGVACPHWAGMDGVSQDVLFDSEVIVIGVDCEAAPESVNFENVPLAEALKIVAFYLEVPIQEIGYSEVAHALVQLVSDMGSYNPMVLEVLIKDWLREGVVMVGSTEFVWDRLDLDRKVSQLENIVSHYSDQLKRMASRTLLGIALAMGEFSEEELRLAASPPIQDFEPLLLELQQVGIFRDGEVAFRESYFVTTGRQIQELRVERRYADVVERNLRRAVSEDQIPFEKYLRTCGNMGIGWTRPVLQASFSQLKEAFQAQNLFEVMDIGQQILEIEDEEALKGFELIDFSELLQLFNYLIETKIILGESVEQELELALKIVGFIPAKMKKDLFADVARLLGLQTEAMYRSNSDLEAHGQAVADLKMHFDRGFKFRKFPFITGVLALYDAKLAYRRADSPEEKNKLSYIDKAIVGLGSLDPVGIEPFDSDVKRFRLQAEGYRLLELGESQELGNVQVYIRKVTEFLDSQEDVESSHQKEANMQLALFLARAFMAPKAEPISLAEGERVSRKIIKRAKENHFRDAGLKGYGYLIDVPKIRGGKLMEEGRYEQAYYELGRMERIWDDMKALAAPLRDQESVARMLLKSQLTWAFGLMDQYVCLERLGESPAPILHRLKKQWDELQIFREKHPRAWLECSSLIPRLTNFLGAH
ncbi:hypothetical protein HN748_00125 [Candidatus Peregrinibacteria bacterium]|nr:hypothetical protein [Candidatus Peregrinibacteria bacterium]MBT7483293.1 hypothetical protein [Candidatus Peregrinibacteria bacterium]MBT7702618.1 hypothetical protein [Candidatus Peregrinibacteria bacterium]